MTSLGDLQGSSDAVEMFVTNVTYTENGSQPVVHLYGRDSGGTRVERTVVGHEPHFSVPAAEYDDRVGQHYSVSSVEDGNQSLDSRQTKRIAVKLPKHVGELREFFDDPLEADVLYAQRFLIDTGITTGARVPSDQRCHVDSVEPCEPPAVDPRVVTLDIEVASDSGFPEPDAAAWPVVSAVAHDNYTDEYTGWILQSDEWDDDVILDASLNDELSLNNASVFDREDRLLAAINSYVSTIRPDILTGWNSNHFDYPYLINRCRELDVWSYQDWSPIGEVYTSKYGPVAKGTAMLDMLGGYEKTQIHKLDDRSLDAIAAAVVGEQKDEIDGYGNVWREDPVSFLSYNHQDTRLVTEIANEAGVIDLFTNIRELSGVSYEDPVGGNFETMDAVFLRRAQEYGYTLPTASKPDRDWYYGAYVFDPEPGLHEHVVYLDVSSLYPSIISMLNISPETIVGYEQPPYAYTKSYVDRRADNVKKDSDPEPTEIYFDDRERGFVPSTVDEMIDLKEQYRGTGMYEATKRITNTVYGFLSDSDSYGKGSRLYDWRMGEAITLAGRKIIQETAEIALMWCRVNGYSDAYIATGDTDGFGVCLPPADDMDEALRVGWRLESAINDEMPSVSADLFEIDRSQNEIEIECESYSDRVFVKGDESGGVMKKYAERERWEQ